MARSVDTLYCDDIRQEINGKFSYIGVYQSELIAQSLPITLPKLCIVIMVRSPIDDPPQSLTVQIRKNEGDRADESAEEILREISVSEEELANAANSIDASVDDGVNREDRMQRLQFMVTFSPMQLDNPCLIRVYAWADDERLRGPGLKVKQAEPTPSSQKT